MALALLHSFALNGLDSPAVTVEVHLAQGLPSITLVGLPDTEVKEAKDRVRAAIVNSGFEFPQSRLTINLAPADLPKASGRFDLAIALGILAASHQIPIKSLGHHAFAGELSLSGELRPFKGSFAMLLANHSPAPTAFFLPLASAAEAAFLPTDTPIYPAPSLQAVALHLRGETRLPALQGSPMIELAPQAILDDMADVRGQHRARRALEIAASGEHSLLMVGPPGSGKSMLAARLSGILPPLSFAAARQVAAIQSISGHFDPQQFGQRPYRAPHHSASPAALIGGGNPPQPGEASLASEGILFLDEFPEFDRKVLETLREPLETGQIHIARAGRRATFPAAFQLIAAMNPCPCGWLAHPVTPCQCSVQQIRKYRARLSGPLLDRIDLQIAVAALPAGDLHSASAKGEPSAVIRERVGNAQARQHARQGMLNAHLSPALLSEVVNITPAAESLLGQIMQNLQLSARTYHRILRVARTIADMSASTTVEASHIAEASQLRRGLTDLHSTPGVT